MKSRWETRPLNPERPKYSGPRNPRLRNTGVNVDTDQIIVGDNPGALGESRGGDRDRGRAAHGAPRLGESAGGVVVMAGPGRAPQQVRSYRWFGDGPAAGGGNARGAHDSGGLRAVSHRSRMRQLGIGGADHLGKPFIAILNTWAEINPCHMHLRERARRLRRGRWPARAAPLP